MNNVEGPWAGRIFGTNTGNVFAEIKQTASELTGSLTFFDDRFGITKYTFTGTINGEITLNCTPKHVPDGIIAGPATVTGQLLDNGSISGRWETVNGTVGVFRLWPHKVDNQVNKTPEPEQVFNRFVSVGSVRIFLNDIKEIFRVIQRDFAQSNLIVTYKQNENEVTKFWDKFLEQIDQLKELREIKLFIQEPDVGGVNRFVSVDLLEKGDSSIRVAGVNESWVVGKAESLRESLSKYENNLVTNWRKYGLTLNTIIFLLMIVFAPEISTWPERLLFVVVVCVLLFGVYSFHSKLIPNTFIILDKPSPGFWSKSWPSIVSWVMGILGSLLAAWLFAWLTNSS